MPYFPACLWSYKTIFSSTKASSLLPKGGGHATQKISSTFTNQEKNSLFKNIHFFIWKVEFQREKETPQESSLICWFTPLMAAMAIGLTLGSGVFPTISHGCRGTWSWIILPAFAGHHQGAGLEMEMPRLQLAPIWDAGTAGSSLTC